MAIYDYQCAVCGLIPDVIAHIADEQIVCPTCGAFARRLFSPPSAIICDIDPYVDENLGQGGMYITSRQHKREVLKRSGLVQK